MITYASLLDGDFSFKGGYRKTLYRVLDKYNVGTNDEWELIDTFEEHDSHCICGHVITMCHVMKHTKSDQEFVVGSKCINQFDADGIAERKRAIGTLKKGKVYCVDCKKAVTKNVLKFCGDNPPRHKKCMDRCYDCVCYDSGYPKYYYAGYDCKCN